MRLRFVAAVPAVALLTSLVSWTAPQAAEVPPEPDVAAEVRSTIASGHTADFVVEFEEQADLREAESIDDWAERGAFVVDALQSTAEDTQAEVVAALTGQGATFTTYWISNSIVVHDGGDEALAAVTDRPEVAAVTALETVPLPELEPEAAAAAVAAVEWGVADIGADQVWSQTGVRGEGVVIGSIDSGVQYDHPALAAAYRGRAPDGSVSHDHNFFDPTGVCGAATPCDNTGHGTHTMGTMVGTGSGNQIGVAPGATWISAKGCASDFCSEADLLASGQWLLAPTDQAGENADPALRPHIVNNSWSGGGTDTFFRPVVDAWRAAGIFPVFSNGNDGPACETVGAPGSFGNTLGVGAYDRDGVIASFSSRGPSPLDGGIKPDVSAPGVAVRSSVPGGSYATADGTSMAAPHVAGAIALVWSASEALRGNVEDTARLLEDTARDVEDTTCGGDADDNNVWGEGKLDALGAVLGAPLGDAGRIRGVVTDEASGDPLPGATLAVGERSTRTDDEGRYSMLVDAGDVTLTATAYGYADVTRAVTVPAGGELTADVALSPLPVHTVTGTVRDGGVHGWPLYAQLEVAGQPDTRVHTDPVTGRFELRLPEGDETLLVSSELYGYAPVERQVTSEAGAEPVDLTLDGGCQAVGYDPYGCQPPPPYGLVVGHVRSAADGAAIDGAEVVAGDGGPWEYTDSRPTPGDDALDDGFFRLVAPPGAQQLTVTIAGYPTATVPVDVVDGGVVRADVDLDAAKVEVAADGLDATTPFGEAAEGSLTLTNSGTLATTVTLTERARLDSSEDTPDVTRVPVQLTPSPTGRLMPDPGSSGGTAAVTPSSGWEPIAPFFTLGGSDQRGLDYLGAAAIDGVVYSVGGMQEIYTGAGNYFEVNYLFAYDPATDTWSRKRPMTYGRGAPAVAAMDGRIFAAGGLDWWVVDGATTDGELTHDNEMAPGLEIYDPATDRWELRDGPPRLRAYGAGVALDGQFYQIGGCDLTPTCDNGVLRYDPEADTWTEVARYPTARISMPVCGAIDGAIYCAGGTADAPTSRTFRYDPDEDRWTEVAAMPVATTDAAGTVANGNLLVSGGIIQIDGVNYGTNEGYAYDPGTNTWSELPPAPRMSYGSAAACGLFRFGGRSAERGWRTDPSGEVLPGLDSCGTGDLPWMTLDRTEVDLAPGETVTVPVRLDGTPLAGPGTELGSIAVVENTPGTVAPVPVTLDVTASRRAAELAVDVDAIGRCGTEGQALTGARVTVETRSHTRTATADADGLARVWVLPSEGRATVTATAPGHQPDAASGLRPRPGDVTSVQLDPVQSVACASVEPGELAATVAAGDSVTVPVTLGNTGATGFAAEVLETPAQLRARPAGTDGAPGVSATPAVSAAATELALPPQWYRMAVDYPDTGQHTGIRMVGCDGRADQLVALDYVRGFVFDPATSGWHEQPRFPSGPAGGTVAVCDVDEVHLLGGGNFFGPGFQHEVYDLNTGQRRSAAGLPVRVNNAAVGIWDGRIYLAGGYGEGYRATDAVQVYDTATDTWEQLEPMPHAVQQAGFAQQGHHLYVVGGSPAAAASASLRLDMITGEWERGPDLGQARYNLGLVATDTAIYALGGGVPGDTARYSDAVERLPLASWPDGTWQPLQSLPQRGAGLGAGCTESLTGGEIWAVGGSIWNGAQVVTNRGVYFRPVDGERCDTVVADVPWLSAAEPGVTVEPDSTASVELTVDASALEPGTHHATVLVRTDDPGAAEVRVPVTVTVTAP